MKNEQDIYLGDIKQIGKGSYEINVNFDDSLSLSTSLRVELPPSYPSSSPPKFFLFFLLKANKKKMKEQKSTTTFLLSIFSSKKTG